MRSHRAFLCLPLTFLAFAGCASAADSASEPTESASLAVTAAASTPLEMVLARRLQDTLRSHGTVDVRAARAMAAFLKSKAGLEPHAEAFLRDLLANGTRVDADARAVIEDALASRRPGDPGLDTPVYRLALGRTTNTVADDDIFLVADGVVEGSTGLVGHSRGYAKLADGVLRKGHGSVAPFLAAASSEENGLLRTQGPHAALDRAAAAYGVTLGDFGFRYLADKVHYDPKAPYWAGLCHAWTYTSLDDRLNTLVEVDGDVGKRGVWIFGQWISRADLGNWLMGVSNHLSVADAELVDSFVAPEDWLKGVTQWVVTSGKGLRADLYNDEEHGQSEIWNQPIFSAEVGVTSLEPSVAAAVVAFARNDSSVWTPLPADASAKLVRIRAEWGSEVRDSYEGPVAVEQSDWNMYVVVDANGRALKGYMANKLPTVAGLPTRTSAGLPDYFAYPKHELVDAAMTGAPDRLLENALEGKYFRFYVGTVLPYAIPEATRAAFEARLQSNGPLDVARIRQEFPGIANAYSEAEWRATFAPVLGDGRSFGAVWAPSVTP
jgi:hypothetical protein